MKTHYTLGFIAIATLFACSEKETTPEKTHEEPKQLSVTEKYYLANVNDSVESISHGSVGQGSLEHATLIPYEGENYSYFDASSYLGGRAYTHSKVAKITVETFESLQQQGVERHFKVMELSRKEGGKIFPHRTHQNGLSVDFMMPLQKNGTTCYELDELGASHYLLEFDKNGAYTEDASISIDFDMAARQILELDKQARKNGMRIHKVIFNTFLQNELFSSSYGKKLRTSGIYVTKYLTPIINELHDDHFHVDFTFL